jgi:NTP pyrophosphatase (non-canonical NTP hydrolase)
MCGEQIRTKRCLVEVQENGIIRDNAGYIIGSLGYASFEELTEADDLIKDLNLKKCVITPNEYQKLAMVTANPEVLKDFEKMIGNAGLGLAGEAGEVADHVKKCLYQGHEFSIDKVAKELGDVLWYVALMCTATGVSLETVMQENVNKLKARYPEGFDKFKSINRGE